MKNKLTLTLTLICLMFMTEFAFAEKLAKSLGGGSVTATGFKETHNAMEVSSLRISLNSKNAGFIEGKVCDACKVIKVNVTSASRAFSNNTEVPLKNAKGRLGRFATVIFELETKNVSEIRW